MSAPSRCRERTGTAIRAQAEIESFDPVDPNTRFYRREDAAKYSFLLAIPAVLASGLYELSEIGGAETPAWGPTILATVISFIVGYAAVAWFLRYISTHSFTGFVVYRLALGFLVILAVTLGWIPALG